MGKKEIVVKDFRKISYHDKNVHEIFYKVIVDDKGLSDVAAHQVMPDGSFEALLTNRPLSKVGTRYTYASGSSIELTIQASTSGENILYTFLDRAGKVLATEQLHIPMTDLPRLIDEAAQAIRDKSHYQPSENDTFLELQLDQSTTQIDPETLQLDPNFGELIFGSKKTAPTGILIGVKSNHLMENVVVERLLIISDRIQNASLAPIQCTELNAAFRYARKRRLAIDWYPASFGAKIAMDSGVENLDACASTAREIIKTAIDEQLPINVIVDTKNIGAQAYWNSLATILPRTKGIMILTDQGSVALTGERTLVAALKHSLNEEEIKEKARQLFPNGTKDLGGYETIYGPNGEAVARAEDLFEACEKLLLHHAFTSGIRQKGVYGFEKTELKSLRKIVEEIQRGRGRHKNQILSLIHDQDTLFGMKFWENIEEKRAPIPGMFCLSQQPTVEVREIRINGFPIMAICPPIGPLTPMDADIISKAIYKASGRIPVLVIGSLTGYHSDPFSMLQGQLIFGASIVDAIVRFEGPLIIVNLGMIIGGTFVTFNKQLNPDVSILAIEGSSIQVVGGAIASKIIFGKKSRKHHETDREIARNYDHVHTAKRAEAMGSVDKVIPLENLKEEIEKILTH